MDQKLEKAGETIVVQTVEQLNEAYKGSEELIPDGELLSVSGGVRPPQCVTHVPTGSKDPCFNGPYYP